MSPAPQVLAVSCSPAHASSKLLVASVDLVVGLGVMAIVIAGGTVQPGATIEVELPTLPHRALVPV